MTFCLGFLLLCLIPQNLAFTVTVLESHYITRSHPFCSSTIRYGLPEWRDTLYGEDLARKPILLLPFAPKEALVQGQSKEILLKDGRFFDLFQDSIDEHESIIGMVLMGDDGILNGMPICEIHDFRVNIGYRGRVTVNVTLRAVGRAVMMNLTQMKPIMTAICTELLDQGSPDISFANELVDDIEATITDIDRIESSGRNKHRYDKGYEVALETATQGYVTTSSPAVGERSVGELTAASWAVFAMVSDKLSLHKAIEISNLIDRLQFGLEILRDEKDRIIATPYQRDSDVGFE